MTRALLCEMFGCLPGEIAEEPADELLKVAQVLGIRNKFLAEKQGSGAKAGTKKFRLT